MSDAIGEPSQSIETNLLITVSGPPGCGATTLCTQLADAIGCPYISGGDIFRDLADKRGLTLTQLTAKAQESDELDRALDKRIQNIAEKWGTANKPCVLESRLAGWIAGSRADLRVWLDAPVEVRKERVSGREETVAEMQIREFSEAQRFDSYYEVDLDDREFYDVHLNTARWSKRSVFDIVRTAIEQYDTAGDEGAFDTPEVPI
jgi:cytidylate kinase